METTGTLIGASYGLVSVPLPPALLAPRNRAPQCTATKQLLDI